MTSPCSRRHTESPIDIPFNNVEALLKFFSVAGPISGADISKCCSETDSKCILMLQLIPLPIMQLSVEIGYRNPSLPSRLIVNITPRVDIEDMKNTALKTLLSELLQPLLNQEIKSY